MAADFLQLWLPILVAAIAVFVASSLVHMVLKWHNSDYSSVPNEDQVAAALREGGIGPGQYILPHCKDMKTAQSPEMVAKYEKGPIAIISLMKTGKPSMGPLLGKWFVLNLVIAAICACAALAAFGLHADPRYVAHLVGVGTFLAYAGGSASAGIWKAQPWGTVAKDVADSLIYALVTALVFWWLWPK